MTAVFAACKDKTKLDTPTGFVYDRSSVTLTWTPVEHAEQYDVYATNEKGVNVFTSPVQAEEDENGAPVTPSVSLAGITEAGTYTIHVQALADEEELDVSGNRLYKDSDVAEYVYERGVKFANPQNVSAALEESSPGSGVYGVRIKFNAVTGAADYTVQILKDGSEISSMTTSVIEGIFIETYLHKDSAGNESTLKFADSPGKYTVQVRANAAAEGIDLNSEVSRTTFVVEKTLSDPLMEKLQMSGASTQTLRWTRSANSKKMVVEAWKIEEGESALQVFKEVADPAYTGKADYTYSPSSATATSCTLSNINITEPGRYLLTVKAQGDGEIYLDSRRVNTVTADEANEESRLFTVTLLASPVINDSMPAADDTDIHLSCTATNGITEKVTLRFDAAALDRVNTFNITLSSVNTSSANSLSDITVTVRLGYNEETSAWEITSDENKGASLTQEGSGYVLEYALDRIFHSEPSTENGEITHYQNRNVYGRYFNIGVQACYYESKTYEAEVKAGESAEVTARLQSSARMADASFLSACEPEYDEDSKTYTIKTTYEQEEDGTSSGAVISTARAQLMYIQKLMLEGEDCKGVTFEIAEDIDFNGNAWLALDHVAFAGTIKSAQVDYSAEEGVEELKSGEYSIKNMFIVNVAQLQYSREEEHESAYASFSKTYAMFPEFSGTLSHVNFIDVTAKDGEYSYTVPGQEATEDQEATDDKTEYMYAMSSAVIAGKVNAGAVIKYVFVSGSFQALNTSGVIAAENNGTITACESDISFAAKDTTGATSAYVGGLVGKNAGTVNASAHRGSVSLTGKNTASAALGGFVGSNQGTITNSYATGSVTGTFEGFKVFTGGFAGENTSNITNSYYGAKFTDGVHNELDRVNAPYAGGFVGNNSGIVTKAYAAARVQAAALAGGFAAQNSGTISYAYSAGWTFVGKDSPAFVGGEETLPANCFMYDYGVIGGEYADIDALFNDALLAGGFGKAEDKSFSTPLLEGLLYADAFSVSMAAGTPPSVKATVILGGESAEFAYDALPDTAEYKGVTYVTGGPGSLSERGSLLLKYVLQSASGDVISCMTVQVSI